MIVGLFVLSVCAQTGERTLGENPPLVRFTAEGALRNDTFQPTLRDAQVELRRGDELWRRVGPPEERDVTLRAEAFDAWQRALDVAGPHDAVFVADRDAETPLWPDPDQTHDRRTEGVANSVLRRLASVTDADRTAWRERFDALATAALEYAGPDSEILGATERRYPLTSGAYQAALRLGDLALERGSFARADEWLTRALFHAVQPQEHAALTARRATLDALRPVRAEQSWERAQEVEFKSFSVLEPRRRSSVRARPRQRPGRGVDPGLAFLRDGSLVVQTPLNLARAAFIDDARTTLRVDRFPLTSLVGSEWTPPVTMSDSAGWPLLPASDGERVALVVGRAGRQSSNALVCVGWQRSGLVRPLWSHLSFAVSGLEGTRSERSDQIPFARYEFQPGPVIDEECVYAQLRTLSEQDNEQAASDELWLFAFDKRTGDVRWSQFITRAADLRSERSARFSMGMLGTPAQPLEELGAKLFVGTNSGLGALYSTCDGRVEWTLRNRRRRIDDSGWPGSRRPLVLREPVPAFAWAPFDSDQLYVLRAAADDGRGVLLRSPEAIGEAEDLAAVGPDGAVVLGRAGSYRALGAWPLAGRRASSLYLGQGERFAGRALASDERLFVSTDRALYLFDLERELLLTASAPLAPAPGGPNGGDVYAQGDRVFVVGPAGLWVFACR